MSASSAVHPIFRLFARRSFVPAAVAVGMLASASNVLASSSAAVSGNLYYDNDVNTSPAASINQLGGVSATGSADLTKSGYPKAHAEGSANLDQGVLKVKLDTEAKLSVDKNGVFGGSYVGSHGNVGAGFSDRLTFSNAQPGTQAVLLLGVSGSFTNNTYDCSAAGCTTQDANAGFWGTARLSANAFSNGAFLATANWVFVSGNQGAGTSSLCYSYYDSCTAGDSFSEVERLTFDIGTDPVTLNVSLNASGNGWNVDASHTLHAYLLLPAGVTYTSDSGVFLRDALPIGSVPEPTSASLALGGLIALWLRGRRGGRDLAR